MTDIVERLRSPEVFIDAGGMVSPVAHEAADEIKRLRAALEKIVKIRSYRKAEAGELFEIARAALQQEEK